jgi:pyruvate/2-oxoglutarate/acetoin dehydrogenase E1 component
MEAQTMGMRDAINFGIAEAMEADPNIMLLGQDIGKYGGTFGVYRGLYERFGPDRVRDGPLCESSTVGIGIGLAITGMRTIVEISFMDFAGIAMDQLVNESAKLHYFTGGKLKVPLMIRSTIASRQGLGSQHSQSLEAWFLHIPGIKVAMPSGARDALGLIRTALREPNPVYLLENSRLYMDQEEVPVEYYEVPFGSARVVREGHQITVIALSSMVGPAVAAAEQLEGEGVSVEVIDPRSLTPLDMDTIGASIRKTGRVVITHDAHRTGGAGAEISSRIMEEVFDYLDGPVLRVCGLDVPIPAGIKNSVVLPDEKKLVEAIQELLNR